MATTGKNLRIGEFIADKLSVSREQLDKIINMQRYLHEKIGEIATQNKLINNSELKIILGYQNKHNVTFGNAAICLGLLKNIQIKYLLDLQTVEKQRIGELLIEEGIIKQDEFLKLIEEFFSKKNASFTILAYLEKELTSEIKEVVEPYHFNFHSCANEEELFASMEKTNPQLVILDCKNERGLALASEISLNIFPKNVKIAYFAPGKPRLEMLNGYEYGVDYILPRPFEPKHLINIIVNAEIQNSEKRKERILIVDDSPIVRESIGHELEISGFQVILAENGKDAVEIAALEKPDLITMDINMPVMDGYKACAILKKHPYLNKIPIIILTANNTWEERKKGFDAGAVEYFTKPFPKGSLGKYIDYLLTDAKKTRPEKILIAEDNALCANIYSSILSKYGFQFEMVGNGKEVFETLESGFNPGIILLDCYMPVMDGFETLSILKGNERYCHIPVIMITVSQKKEDTLRCLKTGAEDYITKPFDEDELIARVEAHIKNFTLLKKLKNKNKIIQLLQEVAVTANEAASAEEAIKVCLEKVCAHTGWQSGHAYLIGPKGRLVSSRLWSLEASLKPEEFRKKIENTLLASGACLPEEALSTGKPVWIADVTTYKDFSGKELTKDFIVKAWFAFPVMEKNRVAAVLEFFSEETIEPDGPLLDAIANLATQLGRVTERKRSEEKIRSSLNEKELLLKEVHHRVKNNMQIISSLLRLQSQFTKEKKTIEMFDDCQNRIQAMAFIHERLYQSKDLAKIDFNSYILNLANSLFVSHKIGSANIALKIDVNNISLGIATAIPCGLILNELISNSLKHAFPNSKTNGEIRVSLQKTKNQKKYTLLIGDNGKGLPDGLDFRNTDSLGLQLITSLAEDQLDGNIKLSKKKGTEFRIQFEELQYKKRI